MQSLWVCMGLYWPYDSICKLSKLSQGSPLNKKGAEERSGEVKMKKKYKNSELNLIWAIPEMLGGLAFIIASLIILTRVPDKPEIWGFVFLIGLVVIILDKGLSWFFKGINNVVEVFTK